VDDDPLGLALSDILGPRNIVWAGQVSRPGQPARMRGLSAEERITVERRNPVSLYGFPAQGAPR
jgi:hypothetical protein